MKYTEQDIKAATSNATYGATGKIPSLTHFETDDATDDATRDAILDVTGDAIDDATSDATYGATRDATYFTIYDEFGDPMKYDEVIWCHNEIH